jgi:hypothetical protein
MNLKTFTLVALLGLFSADAFGQDAHYSYPFSLSCPENLVVSGETVSVGVSFEGGHIGEKYEPTYSWSVSNGLIVSGQGTREVRLQFDARMGDVVDVMMNREFQRAHFPGVQREASCRILLAKPPEARMTDEFRTRGNNCEEGLARLDAFLVELNNDPGANGVIVIYGDTTASGAARIRELQLRRYASRRKFDPTRLIFTQGAARESGTTQFWLVPAGAAQPDVEPATLIARPRPKLPFMHSASYVDGIPECNAYDYDLEDYARVLNEEPKARARIIISESSRARFNRELKELTAQLTRNGVARHRIVGVYKYVRPNRLLESTELWVIAGRP